MKRIECHKLWIQQCEAAEGIKERFGSQVAARYLIGEKLLNFMEQSHNCAELAAELPKFLERIRTVLEPHEIVEVLDDMQAGRVVNPGRIMNGRNLDDDELGASEVVNDAERILFVENARKLLLPMAG